MKIIGKLQNWDTSQLVAIIGPRNPRNDIKNQLFKVAYNMGKKCAQKGKIVVSGLAEGVDTYAHLGALDGGGETIAILSTSPNENIFPRTNQLLSERILKQGALVFPFELSCKDADKKYGLRKNEKPRYILRLLERDILLADMCPHILAIHEEGTIKSGTRWAVNYGVKFNKNVMQFNEKGKPVPLNYKKDSTWWDTELSL